MTAKNNGKENKNNSSNSGISTSNRIEKRRKFQEFNKDLRLKKIREFIIFELI